MVFKQLMSIKANNKSFKILLNEKIYRVSEDILLEYFITNRLMECKIKI